MAWYKYEKFIRENNHKNFDLGHQSGTVAPDAGIYRCRTCGLEIAVAKSQALPAQDHHKHLDRTATVWQLIVAAQS